MQAGSVLRPSESPCSVFRRPSAMCTGFVRALSSCLRAQNGGLRFDGLAVDFQAGEFEIVGGAVVDVADFGGDVAEGGGE